MNNLKIKQKPIISVIACLDKNRAIGKDNNLLFDLPGDLKYFHKVTKRHPVIMGYNTYKSIGRPLKERHNIVISRDDEKISGYIVASSLEDAINKASKLQNDEIFIIGGAKIYNQALVLADRLYITEVNAEKDADTYFPDYSDFRKKVKIGEGEDNGYNYSFFIYEK